MEEFTVEQASRRFYELARRAEQGERFAIRKGDIVVHLVAATKLEPPAKI